MPKVSVIIPNYNHGDHLRRRLDTVLHQTFTDFEVIILDDFSADDSPSIIEAYSNHPSVKHIVFNDVNSGNPFRQWKKGIELAVGEWVWIAESDDFADNRFLEILLAASESNHNAGLIYCDSFVVSNNAIEQETFSVLKNRRFKTKRWSENHSNGGLNEIEDYLLLGGTINNTSAVIFKRDLLNKVNPFDINLRYIGDKYAFVKILSQSDIVYVKETLNYFSDPFNTKHIDLYIFYFYEQFIVFDWVWKNITNINRDKFYKAFYENTRNSLFREWNKTKLNLYMKLFAINRPLLLKSIQNNFRMAVGLNKNNS